jgi:tRNA-intron endonuclease
MCLLVQNKVVVGKRRLQDQLQQKGFGERSEREYVLDLFEAMYLLEKKGISIKGLDGKKVSKKRLLALASAKDKKFYTKYLVFSNLREKGFCVKTGFKFGFDFRVYPRGKKPGQEHTQWVVNVSTQNEKFSMTELSRMVRLSGNVRTAMLFAAVDSENDINYYKVERITP